MQKIRVLVVDDRWLVHRGMSSLFFDSDEAVEQVSRLAPDLVVLADGGAEPLTRRETEILRLIARGLEDREISRALHISMGTVRTHMSNVLGKLGLRNRVEATLFALRHGLVSLDS